MGVRRILVAEEAGACYGVERALALAEKASSEATGPVHTLGPLIHNPRVVADLEAAGVTVVRTPSEAAGATLILRTHGVTPEVEREAREKCAKVIDASSNPDEIGLFDKVTIYIEEDDEEQTIELVTTLRQNALKGLISKESPVGKAILGKKVGDRVEIVVSPEMKYTVEIRSITPGEDDASLEISSY